MLPLCCPPYPSPLLNTPAAAAANLQACVSAHIINHWLHRDAKPMRWVSPAHAACTPRGQWAALRGGRHDREQPGWLLCPVWLRVRELLGNTALKVDLLPWCVSAPSWAAFAGRDHLGCCTSCLLQVLLLIRANLSV